MPPKSTAVSPSSEAGFRPEPSIPGGQSFQSVLNQQLARGLTSVQYGNRATAGYNPPSPQRTQTNASISSSAEVLQAAETWFEYAIEPGDTLWDLAIRKFHVDVEDLIRDNDIQDPRRLKPGQKIRVRQAVYSGNQEVVASWYGPGYHGKPMANGQPYNMHASTIAHKDLPLGTIVELQNPATGQKVNAVVADRGPFIAGRDVDLSYGLAQQLSLAARGVGKLVMRVVG
jgi:rare lipoprotein A